LLGDGSSNTRANPGKIPFNKNISFFEYRYFNSFFQTTEGELYTFGRNTEGSLGLEIDNSQNTPILHSVFSNISKISIGSEFTFLLYRNSWYSFGKNSGFQLGQEIVPLISSNAVNASISSGTEFTMYVNGIGELYSNGYNVVNILFSNYQEKTIGRWDNNFIS
jgi:alpha-tubulin suppressor-like RCC1 family protein